MKKIILFLGLVLFVTSSVFSQEDLSGLSKFISSYPIITTLLVIAHICLTVAVYKMKGGAWACFYFFLAPVVILLLLVVLVMSGESKSKSNNVHHYFH